MNCIVFQLCQARIQFLTSQPNMPKRYIKLLAKPSAHSDDEARPNKKNSYTIKTLKFRSANMNKFVRRLDVGMEIADSITGKYSQRHSRLLPKTPVFSEFVSPPTQLPIDFYNPAWFNAFPPAQKEKIANSKTVALLPDASESFLSTPHPSESLSGKKFNDKYYARLIKPYQLVQASQSDDEDLERTGNVDVREEIIDDAEDGIDLTAASDGEDADDDEYYAEGEFGDLYDGNVGTSKWIESDDSEEDDEDYVGREEEEEEGDSSDDVDKDGDMIMETGKEKSKTE